MITIVDIILIHFLNYNHMALHPIQIDNTANVFEKRNKVYRLDLVIRNRQGGLNIDR